MTDVAITLCSRGPGQLAEGEGSPPRSQIAAGFIFLACQNPPMIDARLAPELREHLFQPFAAGERGGGSGLGLAICGEIVRTLGGSIALDDRVSGGRIAGLDATVRVPLADNQAR